MREDIKYITLDGRGEDISFRDTVQDVLNIMKPGEGLHIIREFEPILLYALFDKKGMEKHVEKRSDEEYHVWFYPQQSLGEIEMKKHIVVDQDRINKMLDIKLKVFKHLLTPVEAKKLVNQTFDHISAEEFAYGEQHLYNSGITDEIMAEGMDDMLEIFKDVLVVHDLDIPKGHPIHTYTEEAVAIRDLIFEMEQKLKAKFIKNEWLGFYTKLNQITIHFSRKQHQLFPALERKGFDRPTKIMWSFDDKVRDAIKAACELLKTDQDQAFIDLQPRVFYLVHDILGKERDVLFPTALKLIDEAEFAAMRISDDEIGYCLIEKPPAYPQKNDLSDIPSIEKPEAGSREVLDVSIGQLTLEQINLVFKHIQVDLSYVDENDVVKFYTDTRHRVFPRSAGVIGRKVQNCHPRESVAMVEEIIHAFRSGEQDKAEFWLEMGDKFIYIIYNAVRDNQGNYKGVIEMMQDVTHIRGLKGSQKLLSWNQDKVKEGSETINIDNEDKNSVHIGAETTLGELIKQFPYLKQFLLSLSPKYNQLNNPVVFSTMKNIASLGTISKRGGFELDDFLLRIRNEIDRNEANATN